MAGRSSMDELELTGEEARRLAEAFRDERFRALFAEYAAELADPQQRAAYEAEVAALERQRGVEARFLHPAPGWVLRTSQGGARRCYLNVCSNALVGRPEARPEPGGSCWTLPHCLAPGREELSRRRPRGPRRLVYDVLFHPDTLRLAARSARFRRLVDDTALEAVERHFSPGLDRANAAPLRGTKYKGVPQAALLRRPLPGGAPPEEGEGDSPLPPVPSPYAYPPPAPERAEPPAPPPPAAATPRWTLRQRSYVDLQDYRDCRDSAPSPVPRELVATIELPLLGSAAQAQLEIRGRELRLDSPRPAAYRLRLRLPYAVDEGRGRATFDKAKRQLVVVLPVLPRPGAAGQAKPEPEPEPELEPAPAGGGPAPGAQPREDCAGGRGAEQAPPPSRGDASGAACAPESPPAAPASPRAAVPAPPEAPARAAGPGAPLCAEMELRHQCPGITSAVSPAGPGGGSVDSPVASLACHGGRQAGQRPELPASADLPLPNSHVELGAPELGLGDGSSVRPLPSPAGLSPEGDAPVDSTDPSALPASSPPSRCPPFHCTQDDQTVTLLLQVPDIISQSFRGEVGAHHYRTTFSSKASGAYECCFQFLPENKLSAPEIGVNVSPSNAVITLAKLPKSSGLWTKLYFGPNANALQERWFVTENNVDAFLLRTSCSIQSEMECQPLLEVLDVSEGKSQIRVKQAQEQKSREPGETEGSVNLGREDGEQEHEEEAEEGPVCVEGISGSLAASETAGRVGRGSGHCLVLDPPDPSLAAPEKSLINGLHESPRGFTTGDAATSAPGAPLEQDRPAQTGEKAEAELAHPEQGLGQTPALAPAPPVLKETNMKDGSVEYITQHSTRSAVTLQNALLYELD